MRLAPTLTALAVCSLLAGLPLQLAAQSAVEVSFTNPEKFRDANLRGRGYGYGADDFVLKEIRATFEKLGERYLGPGQTLRIDVQDIDLAGRYEPWRAHAYDVRFMRDITWPSMKLHYELSQDGKPLASGDARLSDMSYLQRPGRSVNSSDRLYAEKVMLNDWFRKQFGDRRVGSVD
ncbi:DUF3016 domain-containing protein [Zestomonas carbonaria]|uniref:DUF3016 domain-containing protein n=1 Tax=Zestomonas carbonaria TaxID=2762745 RepID=A0A7U7ESV2_9GAMM|nr:DUF3016 domain-containing protein [Pseudomonas carbonaria]CAD5110524.1 hypothetical protein PSEWESI4_04847 [Pseudomonas carbonaria]